MSRASITPDAKSILHQNRFFSGFNRVFPNLKKRLSIDLGSAVTKIILDGKSIFEEPTCINIHKSSGLVVAVGQKALSSWKKTPDNIETIFPVRYGAIANQEITEKYLRNLLKKLLFLDRNNILTDLQWSFQNISGKYCLGNGLSPLDKDIFAQVMKNVGLGKLRPVQKSESVLKSIDSLGKKSDGFCVLDIGSQTTELGMMVDGKMVHSSTFLWGGDDFTNRIKQIILAKYGYEVSWESAEIVKKQIGQIFIDDKRDQKLKNNILTIRGKDIAKNIVGAITVSANDFSSDLLDVSKSFIDEVGMAFDKISIEILEKAIEGGVFLIGGSSSLKDLDEYLANKLNSRVIVMKNPETLLIRSLDL